MNTRTLLFSTALLAPLFLASRAPAARVKFAPADGSSVTKTFENKTQLSLDEYSMSGAGGGPTPKMEMTQTTSQKVVVTDDYGKVKDGVPQSLKRTFDELGSDSSMSMKMEIMGQSRSDEQNMRGKSELLGKKVAFTWDAEKGEYKKAFDPAEAKDEVLQGLTEDMDLRCLLTDAEVKEGDEWDITLKGLRDVLMPGGNLALLPENTDEKSMKMGMEMSNMSDVIGDKLEGTAKGKLTALKEVDGAKVAVIHVDLKIHSKADMSESARKMLKSTELPPEVGNIEIDHLDVEFSFEGEGDLVWDLGAGHFRSLELSGQQNVKTDTGTNLEVQGKKLSITENRVMSGTASYTAKAK